MKVLITCPPMLRQLPEFEPEFKRLGWEVVAPEVVQTLSEEELSELLPEMDGWIIGDDPATARVLEAGKRGRLRAVVKWGVGVDNVDFEACKRLGLPVSNTPLMFGNEVADLALHYLIGLARETFRIDRGVRAGAWPKPSGISLQGKTAAVIGFGDIGRNVARRLYAIGMRVLVYDPFAVKSVQDLKDFAFHTFPQGLEEAHFVVVTCALTPATHHLLDARAFGRMRRGVRVVNVSRGAVIDQGALVEALRSGQVHSAALDVFEQEPLPAEDPLRAFEQCIFGTHNASNTVDAVRRASFEAIRLLDGFLKGSPSAVPQP
ncbi:MAG: phosphoglycerate dehydrogenase [Bacteroidetes bacterium]|nr:MAG: phosphoglycerate dehydrogenase [Bacteroidota bacterium]